MTDRLASYTDFISLMKGGSSISPNSEEYTAANMILDGVSTRMAGYIFKSPFYRLAQLTSDGISSPTEFYGTEHYGLHGRNVIRLKRAPVQAILSIIDNTVLLTADQYQVDYNAAIIYRNVGRFYRQRKIVQVIYTAGYASNGNSNADGLALDVPDDLRNACIQQSVHEFSQWAPGGVPLGVTTVSRPDGSMVFTPVTWLIPVKDVLDKYRNR